MAGINQGRPEVAVGEPIHFGDIDGFELEHHPISDRLIIRDTENGTVAYVRGDRGGEIGGDGVLIKALKEGKPMADDGRTHDSIQAAERAASSWVFVPPGTFNESVEINTEGLTLRGSGYNSLIDGKTIGNAIIINESNVTISDIQHNTTNGGTSIGIFGANANILNTFSTSAGDNVITANDTNTTLVDSCRFNNYRSTAVESGDDSTINNCFFNAGKYGVVNRGKNTIMSNNIIKNIDITGLYSDNENTILIGNRVLDGDNNVVVTSNSLDSIVANNRVSDAVTNDIVDNGTGTVLDGNLTGPSN